MEQSKKRLKKQMEDCKMVYIIYLSKKKTIENFKQKAILNSKRLLKNREHKTGLEFRKTVRMTRNS